MSHRRKWLKEVSLLGLSVSVCGCTPKSDAKQSSATYAGTFPIRATATVGMVADLARAIGGSRLQVTQLMGAGVDPHLYKPTRDDVQAILSSDIVFYNGLMLEGKMSEVFQSSGRSRPTCAVGEQLKLPDDIRGTDPHHPDPHVWMDVSLWSQAAGATGKFLSKFDPPHAEEYTTQSQKLQEQLNLLHAYGQEIIASIPQERRVLITSHDAFRYFGRAYGIEVQAIQGISTDSEAGLQRINQLVDLLVARKIEAVFVESSVPRESIEALLEGAQSRGQAVKIGGELYSDAMGPDGTYAGTYIGMMDHNLTTIARALGAAAVPEDGFKGYRPSAR